MSTSVHYILRIQCPDREGLIATITTVVASHQLNVVVMKEFVEPLSNTFFARLEIAGSAEPNLIVSELEKRLPPSAQITFELLRKKKIIILVTKEHHCLSDLLIRHHFGELPVEIVAVIGNYEKLRPFTEKMEIPFHFIDHDVLAKPMFESFIRQAIDQYQPDIIVLAKFMRILSPDFVQHYPNRIINIHHSFLPAFVGAHPYRQAYERGVKLIGATAHFVTNDLDEGPIITQKVISVDHEYTTQGMIQAGHEVEKGVLAEAIKLVVEDRVFVIRNRTIIFD